MIEVLTGENIFALRRELTALTDAFVSVHGDIAVERLDGEEADFQRLQEGLQSLPFLASRKLVIARTPGVNKQFVEHIESVIDGIPETTDLIIVEPKLDKRSNYYKVLKQKTDLREFRLLDESGLALWLVAIAKEQGGSLGHADARFLIERVGTDQQLLERELEKLLTYDAAVTHHTIELLTESASQSKIFDLLEAAFAGRPDRTLALYREQREQRVDPSQIIALLGWQLKIMAIVKAAGRRNTVDIIRDAKLSSFTVQKAQRLTHRISLNTIKVLVSELLALDVRSKRENVDLDEALQNYLLGLNA